ncbi:MAG: LysM peptidoglycan-binding domain-containing protein, partial [Gammaproteobacteria bacterium]|nr:LysM peptidoglycan-binding domain-containing protein [Gammaproteobacteria bacterium]
MRYLPCSPASWPARWPSCGRGARPASPTRGCPASRAPWPLVRSWLPFWASCRHGARGADVTMGATAAVRVASWCAVMPVLLAACLAHPPAPVSERSLVVGPTPAVYTVNKYDTLYSVAWRYELDVDRLAERNGIEPPYLLRRGQRIVLTGTGPAVP